MAYTGYIAVRKDCNLIFPVVYTQSATPWERMKFNISGGICAKPIAIGGKLKLKISGGDTLRGNTRTHPEHVFHAYVNLLSLKRPMVLYWRRYGRAGGCRIPFHNLNETVIVRWAYSSAG